MSPIYSASSSRWNPTPEQLMILEEMYRSDGVRTPNASQIQQITAHLSRYGKIEGKNVFYWFQNHKARDRQRLRRKLTKLQLYHNIMLHPHNHDLTTSLPQLSHPSSIGIFQQGGSMVYSPSIHMDKDSYSWKLNKIPELKCQLDDDLRIMKLYGCDSTTMLDGGAPTCTKTLETLELFPITSTGDLKEDCTTPKHFPSPSTLTN